jgi:hypothetical protein
MPRAPAIEARSSFAAAKSALVGRAAQGRSLLSRRSPGRRMSRNHVAPPEGSGNPTGAASSGSRPDPRLGPYMRRCRSRRPSRTVPDRPRDHRAASQWRGRSPSPGYTRHLNKLRIEKNAALGAAQAELVRLTKQRENIIQAIKDGVPATEVKNDLARIVMRREELDALLSGDQGRTGPASSVHGSGIPQPSSEPSSGAQPGRKPGEAADILRSLVDRIELRPNQQGKLEIDLYGDLAGILTLAGRKDRPLDQDDQSVQQVKVVAGVGFEPTTFRL